MTQIYNMNTDDIRSLAYEYIRQGIPSRAIQCFERLLWLGSLRRREYLRLAALCACHGDKIRAKHIINRYYTIFK
jgi:two-component SAPR family response regulator